MREGIHAEEVKIKNDALLHHLASVVGGFMGAYAILNYVDMFGSSQTSNMIRIVSGFIIGTGIHTWLIRLGAFLLYAAALALTVIIPKFSRVSLHVWSVIATALSAIFLALMPDSVDHEFALYPIFFASAFQWNSFLSVGEYVSSSIFSANNLKQAVTSATEYIFTREPKHANKAKFYWLTLLFYHIGAVFCALSYVFFARLGIFFIFFPLSVLAFFVLKLE